MFDGMIARPRATSSRTNSAGSPSRTAMNSISGVISPLARVVELRDRLTGRARRAGRDPRLAQLRQAVLDVVALRAAGVVEAHRRLAAGQRDLAHRHADALRAVDEDFSWNWETLWRTLTFPHSLRRFEPDQVPRVYLNPGLAGIPLAARPLYRETSCG